MRELVISDLSKCEGCNKCIRVCPVEEANIAFAENNRSKVKTDPLKCICCGACVQACQHEARIFADDTELFFDDLRRGMAISLFAAPANRTNFVEWGRLFSWLKQLGVRKIYDVSLGADICTWAHIRYIQRNGLDKPIITQPCPAIVSYITKYRPELVGNLSPIHSPMLCTAIYMKKYEKIGDRIAALSPCIAKAHEFDDTGYVSYNVTFKKINEYIQRHGIQLPLESTGFDHFEASMGKLYASPGGLKENVEFFIGKVIRIEKSEGQNTVYKNLDAYAGEDPVNLPAIFDVLNCPEGCNQGTGCEHEKSVFEISRIMDDQRQQATVSLQDDFFQDMYDDFDKKLNLDYFIRSYRAQKIPRISISAADIENAFQSLGKHDDYQRKHNCYACGSLTCQEMAEKIAKKINVAENCIEKTRLDLLSQHTELVQEQIDNLINITTMLQAVSETRQLSETVSENILNVKGALNEFAQMSKMIDRLAMQTHLISLNASIEAVKAGKAGNCFLVVADEIRLLAKSSKETVERNDDTYHFASKATTDMDELLVKMRQTIESTYDNLVILSESARKAVNLNGLESPVSVLTQANSAWN